MRLKDKNKLNLYFCIDYRTDETYAIRTLTETGKLIGIHADTLSKYFKTNRVYRSNIWCIYKDKV